VISEFSSDVLRTISRPLKPALPQSPLKLLPRTEHLVGELQVMVGAYGAPLHWKNDVA
jgi:hypothetical protein